MTGWSIVASGGYGSGASVINNVTDQSAQYPRFSNPLVAPAGGTYYALVSGYDGAPAETIYQDVTANGQGNLGLQPNTTYTLTVAVGVSHYTSQVGGTINLINGTNATGTVLASINASTLGQAQYSGSWKDLTVSFTTGATVSGDLTIAISNTHGYPSSGSFFIDNVRLTKLVTTVGGIPATTFNIANNGFEAGTLSNWTTIASSGYNSGAGVVDNVANQSAQYPSFNNPMRGTAEGSHYAIITGYDGNPAEVIYQDVTANGLGNLGLQPNTTYSLLVSIGVSRYGGVNNGYVSLINGTNNTGTVLATANTSPLGMSQYMGLFRDLLVTYTTGATVSGHLTIAIGTTHGYPSSGALIVDNVRLVSQPVQTETIGGGTVATPAVGPVPAYGIGGTGVTLVKNWDFGSNGTIKNNTDLVNNFQFRDPFNQIANSNYGAVMVSPDAAHAKTGQPVEGTNTGGAPVRQYFSDSMKTYIVPLNGATTLNPASLNTGSGSFQAIWALPTGGAFLGKDIVWETRVRYVTPPYFWFAIWNCGNNWQHGGEMDLVESFGYDNSPQGGGTNYNGLFWHSNTVSGTDALPYNSWGTDMKNSGFASYDPTQYHIWTLLYRKDNSYVVYVDGTAVQSGPTYYWTANATAGGPAINMNFLFDGTWGSRTIASTNHTLPASAVSGTYYEWDYSRVYLK